MEVKVNAKKVNDYIWENFDLNINELRRFGNPPNSFGGTSIILIGGDIAYKDKSIEFDLSKSKLINIGNGNKTLLIRNEESQFNITKSLDTSGSNLEGIDDMDAGYLRELEKIPELKDVGYKILQTIRKEDGGYFEYYASTGYVQKPDNFWTVKVQYQRAKSLSISVRGTPNYFSNVAGIEKLHLKTGMNGYSRFNVTLDTPLNIVIQVLRNAKRKNK